MKDLVAQPRAERQQIAVRIVRKVRLPDKILLQRLIVRDSAYDHALVQRRISRDRRANTVSQYGWIAGDVVQRILKECASVVHPDDEAALAFAIADSRGTAVGVEHGCTDIGSENADVGETAAQLGDQCAAGTALAVQKT